MPQQLTAQTPRPLLLQPVAHQSRTSSAIATSTTNALNHQNNRPAPPGNQIRSLPIHYSKATYSKQGQIANPHHVAQEFSTSSITESDEILVQQARTSSLLQQQQQPSISGQLSSLSCSRNSIPPCNEASFQVIMALLLNIAMVGTLNC